jgi:hypothetical protein
MLEMGESLKLTAAIVELLLTNETTFNYKIYSALLNTVVKKNKNTYTYMEDIITHFLQ